MKTQKSAEDYLETILILSQREGRVRSVDIANEMNFTKPSVSNAMKKLREKRHITVDPLGGISLTESGAAIAERIYERHTLLTRLLMDLGVDEAVAREDACRIEHDISAESFQKMKEHYLRHQKESSR